MTYDDELRVAFEALDIVAAMNRGEPLRDKIRAQVGIWRHNRELYPRWVVAPWSNRSDAYQNTIGWVRPILDEVSHVAAHEQVLWLRELAWRLDVCLLPVEVDLAKAVERALNASAFQAEDATAFSQRPLAARADLCDCIALSVLLLTHYRETTDVEAFEHLETRLLGMPTIAPDLRSHICYQRILLHLSRLENAKGAAVLSTWAPPLGDLIWAVRRAALTIEMGGDDGARLVREALAAVQDALPRGPVYEVLDFHLLSCEGWALANVLNLRGFAISRGTGGRLEDLAMVQCDPFDTLARIKTMLATRGSDRQSQRLLRAEPSDLEYALQAIRLIEVGGCIVRIGNELVAASLLKVAAQRVAEHRPLRGILAHLRLGDARDLQGALNAKTVSRLSVDEIKTLSTIFRAALRESMPIVSRIHLVSFGTPEAVRNMRAQNQAEAALAGLGALSSRFQPEIINEIVGELSVYRRTWRSGVWQVRMQLDETTNVILTVLNATRRSDHTLDLLDQPLAGAILDMPAVIGWQNDPFGLLIDAPPGDRTIDPDRWRVVIDKLIHETATTENPATRANGVLRFAVLHRMGLLTLHEQDRLAAAIWAPDGLAMKFTLPSAYLLALPDTTPALAERAIRLDVIERPLPRFLVTVAGEHRWSMNQGAPYDVLVNMLRVTRTPVDPLGFCRLGVIEWTSDEVETTLNKIEAWWHEEGRRLFEHLEEQTLASMSTWRFVSIVEAITYLVLPHRGLAAKAGELLRQLAEAGVEISLALPIFLLENPSRSSQIAEDLRQRLVSNDPVTATAAMRGAFLWFKNEAGSMPAMPFDLPREIGAAVCHRRQPGLSMALYLASEIIALETETSFRQDIGLGLYHLRLETIESGAEDQARAFPAERGLAIRLLAAYAQTADPANRIIEAWLESAEDEPFERHRTELIAIRESWLGRARPAASASTDDRRA